ncbi:MBL fold metallo-hydrolase [Polycladomyces subterraneus]|uniref:MBL fold metallo-hydrolase n=1 Tax=Polycladomyces subterraneus TaxID=1016997 RepID=A0ABT8IRB1_9BACL|nr:MBL fold metallo-hydrolase [Polycladomyces subterraneus]MDN4594932.1 MBL fold metallo-hydrolase [Polycladomyces subterraneus]
MNVRSFTLGPVATNCYVLSEGREAVVIDPGMGPDPVLEWMQSEQLNVQAILLTHAHFDHIGGVEAVRTATGAPVYVHRAEADWLTDPQKNGSSLFPGLELIRCNPADQLLEGGETLNLIGREFRVYHTPGHSPGSVTFQFDDQVFSGDVLFAGSIGRTDLPGGDYETLMRSIHDVLMEMPEETRVYPGHGPTTTIGREQASNPFVTGMMG